MYVRVKPVERVNRTECVPVEIENYFLPKESLGLDLTWVMYDSLSFIPF